MATKTSRLSTVLDALNQELQRAGARQLDDTQLNAVLNVLQREFEEKKPSSTYDYAIVNCPSPVGSSRTTISFNREHYIKLSKLAGGIEPLHDLVKEVARETKPTTQRRSWTAHVKEALEKKLRAN